MKSIKLLVLLLLILCIQFFLQGGLQLAALVLTGLSLPFWWGKEMPRSGITVLIAVLATIATGSILLLSDGTHLSLLAQNTALSTTQWLAAAALINGLTAIICLLIPAALVKTWLKPTA